MIEFGDKIRLSRVRMLNGPQFRQPPILRLSSNSALAKASPMLADGLD